MTISGSVHLLWNIILSSEEVDYRPSRAPERKRCRRQRRQRNAPEATQTYEACNLNAEVSVTRRFSGPIALDQFGHRIEPGTGLRLATKPRDSRHRHSAHNIVAIGQ
jgi:hypothetical protein